MFDHEIREAAEQVLLTCRKKKLKVVTAESCTGGLIAAGVPKEVATPAVLFFRLLTFWLPVLPGWLAFTHLTRKGEL